MEQMNRQEKKEEILQQIEVLKKQVEELDQEFKVGDWVVFDFDKGDNCYGAYLITRIGSDYYMVKGHPRAENRIEFGSLRGETIRHATPEEIEQAKLKEEFPYEVGDVCAVRDSDNHELTQIEIYLGGGKFSCGSFDSIKNKMKVSWNYHKPYKKEDWI